jgi:hypothetical protein
MEYLICLLLITNLTGLILMVNYHKKILQNNEKLINRVMKDIYVIERSAIDIQDKMFEISNFNQNQTNKLSEITTLLNKK